jgi:GNAT superfamily N-acetyltransferase
MQYPRDGKKNPENSLEWIFGHGLPRLRAPGYVYEPPHQIYIAFMQGSEQIADVAGLVPDDRGVAKQLGLVEQDPHYFGFFGGHRVHPDLRGRGVGTLMIRHRAKDLQRFVDNVWCKPASVYAFLINPISGRLLEREAGFENLGERYIEDSQGNEFVFRRLFAPTQ